MADIPAMVAMLRPHAAAERLLPRTARQVAERLRDYVLAERIGPHGAELAGVASLSLVDLHLAEVGALAATAPEVEAALVSWLLDDAATVGVSDAFVLTADPDLFESLGFSRAELAAIPEKRDRQCLRCSRLPRCRQVALTRPLDGARQHAAK